jgi:hypothetical protein
MTEVNKDYRGKVSIMVVRHYYSEDGLAVYVTIENVLNEYKGAYIGNKAARWYTYDYAAQWIDEQYNADYWLRYEEFARPDYYIVKAKRYGSREAGKEVIFSDNPSDWL